MELKGKQVTDSFTEDVDSFWASIKEVTLFACPNVSLFRLIGRAIGDLANKRVLEIGFGHGADLMECKRRGADVSGLDLNPKFVETVKKQSQCDVQQFKAGKDIIPFKQYFNLIYSRDTICYLTDLELAQFFFQCYKNLTDKGSLIVQFIETDLKLSAPVSRNGHDFDASFLSDYKPYRINKEENPIRFLSADAVIAIAKSNNLNLVGTKRLLQSYDLQESEFRVDKYLIFEKI